MLKWNVTSDRLRRSLMFAAVLSAGVASLSAQTGSQTVAASGTPAVATDQAQPAAAQVPSSFAFSSSAAQTTAAPVMEASLLPANPFGDPMQYGGGQRGRAGARPRYRGNNTNADGSNKWIFYAGAGLQQPIGNTWHYYTPSWALQVGGGRQFSKKLAVPIEFDYDNAGLTGQTLNNQLTLYNNQIVYYCGLYPSYCNTNDITTYSSLDGNAHVWSFSVDPTYTFFQAEKVGAYAVAGAGFYHKVTNFTAPEEGVGYSPYYGYYEYEANEIIDHYTSNAPGFSAGFGVTYKFSRFSNERFYAEAKYVFVDNSHRAGINVNSTVNATTIAAANDFSPNSNHTTYFPIKVGIRF